MIGRGAALLPVLALSIALAQPARAQMPIVADVANAWKHEQTGLTLPPTLAGFERESVAQYDNAQRDVAVAYRDEASRTETTLYVFFAGLPDVSLWHDRIKAAMNAGLLGTPDFANAAQTGFVAPGETVAGGLRTTATMAGKGIKASGVAIFAHDGWIVAVRMSSGTLERDALDQRLAAFVAGLALPAAKAAPVPPYVIETCTTTMPDVPAKQIGTDPKDQVGLAGLLGIEGLVSGALEKAGVAAKAAPTGHWCRDAVSQVNFGVYRRAGDDGFVIGVSDAGTAVSVESDPIMRDKFKTAAAFSVFLSTVSDRTAYGVFDGVPTWRQVIELVNAHHPLAAVARPVTPGTGGNVTIFASDPAKKAP